LHSFGHQVIYLACNGRNVYKTDYKVKPVKFTAKAIVSAAVEEKPDIIYWRNNKHSAFRESVRKFQKKRVPVVFAVSHISDIIKWKGFQLNPRKSVFKQLVSRSIQIMKSRWNHGGFKWVSGIVVNNMDHLGRLGILPEIYIPNSNTSDKVSFSWEKPYVCWIANLKPRKRPELCIEVAKSLGKKYDILVAGEIQDSNYGWFSDPGKLPENLVYLGPKSVEQVNGIIASSLCLIHTCTPEGFPGNFIQAWLQGIPVVSYEFDPGGLIQSEELGSLSGGNLDRFITDIKEYIEDPFLNKATGERAKLYAELHFSPETNVRRLERFLLQVIHRHIN
jgi:glycosyltransferase involved in cell wall biosynthesis